MEAFGDPLSSPDGLLLPSNAFGTVPSMNAASQKMRGNNEREKSEGEKNDRHGGRAEGVRRRERVHVIAAISLQLQSPPPIPLFLMVRNYKKKDPAQVSKVRASNGKQYGARNLQRGGKENQKKAVAKSLEVVCPECGHHFSRKKPRVGEDDDEDGDDGICAGAARLLLERGPARWLEAYCLGRDLLRVLEPGDELLGFDIEVKAANGPSVGTEWASILNHEVCPRVPQSADVPERVAGMVGTKMSTLQALMLMQLHPLVQAEKITFSKTADLRANVVCGALLGRLRSEDLQRWFAMYHYY